MLFSIQGLGVNTIWYFIWRKQIRQEGESKTTNKWWSLCNLSRCLWISWKNIRKPLLFFTCRERERERIFEIYSHNEQKQPIIISPSSLGHILSQFYLETMSFKWMAIFHQFGDHDLIYKGLRAKGLGINMLMVQG